MLYHRCILIETKYPKMIAKISAAALELTPEGKDRLEELRNSPNDLNRWRRFHEEFGKSDVSRKTVNYAY
jgi:hypothetical protein